MILEIKVNYYELLSDGKMRIAANVEDFKTMLDGVNPRIYCDYLCEKLQITNYELRQNGKEGKVCKRM